MEQRDQRGARFFYGLFVAIGLGALSSGCWTLIQSLRTERWPQTEGWVLSARIVEGDETYSAKITYSYQVDGVQRVGERLCIGQMSASSRYAQGILKRYPVGKQVAVYFAPGDPSQAVLETGIHGGTWIYLATGTLFTLFGAMFLRVRGTGVRARTDATSLPTSSLPPPDRRLAPQSPPALMGVILLLMGSGLCFLPPDSGQPVWLMFAVGGVFASGGVVLLLMRLENKFYARMATLWFMVPFLAVAHWVSFGGGARTATTTDPSSLTQSAPMRMPFAAFTLLVDVAIVAGGVRWLIKR